MSILSDFQNIVLGNEFLKQKCWEIHATQPFNFFERESRFYCFKTIAWANRQNFKSWGKTGRTNRLMTIQFHHGGQLLIKNPYENQVIMGVKFTDHNMNITWLQFLRVGERSSGDIKMIFFSFCFQEVFAWFRLKFTLVNSTIEHQKKKTKTLFFPKFPKLG